MPVKIDDKTKRLALQKLRDGLGTKEVANLTGVSVTTLKTWRQKYAAAGIASGNNGQTPVAQPAAPATEQSQDDKTTLDFEASPAPVEHKGIVDSALSSLKGMLGIADSKDKDAKAAPPILSAKLDAKRQQFVDSATPTLALAFMALASWWWGRIDPEYGEALEPTEAVAQRIVEPLIRIYARHANFLTDINPDVADVGASMFALIAYVRVSLKTYQQIKLEKAEYEESLASGIPYQRGYRHAPESGLGDTSNGHADVRGAGADVVNAGVNGSNGRHPGYVDIPHLSDKEAQQHAALSRLSQLDYQSRARRSGRAS